MESGQGLVCSAAVSMGVGWREIHLIPPFLCRPIHGLIFLFKWVQDDEPAGPVVTDDRLDNIFFAKQVINNACATQAILSILFNIQNEPNMHLGETLGDFKSFCASFDPYLKGLTLSNSAPIRTVHNSFARQTLYEMDSKAPNKEDVFHFVGYVPINGRLYELDGLKEGPLDLGACGPGQEWLDNVRPIIEKRMQKYSQGEIHFNLMAVVSDRQTVYQKQIETMQSDSQMDDGTRESELIRLQELIQEDERKKKRYKVENIRRKHNYLPLIVEILKKLGDSGQLMPLYEKAKQRAAERETAKGK